MNKKMDELAQSVTLLVWARVTMVVSGIILVLAVPVAGWWAGEVWASIDRGIRAIHRVEIQMEKLDGRLNLLESRQNDMNFRIDRIETRVR